MTLRVSLKRGADGVAMSKKKLKKHCCDKPKHKRCGRCPKSR